MREATERQIQYVDGLLKRHFGELRHAILKEKYKIGKSSELGFWQADEIISNLNPDGYNDRWKQKMLRLGREAIGQGTLL